MKSVLVTEKSALLKWWAEHFNGILNRLSTINDDAIDWLPQVDVNHSMAKPPSLQETEKAIMLLSKGKAPGLTPSQLSSTRRVVPTWPGNWRSCIVPHTGMNGIKCIWKMRCNPITQTTFGDDLRNLWQQHVCSVEANASWCVPDINKRPPDLTVVLP